MTEEMKTPEKLGFVPNYSGWSIDILLRLPLKKYGYNEITDSVVKGSEVKWKSSRSVRKCSVV